MENRRHRDKRRKREREREGIRIAKRWGEPDWSIRGRIFCSLFDFYSGLLLSLSRWDPDQMRRMACGTQSSEGEVLDSSCQSWILFFRLSLGFGFRIRWRESKKRRWERMTDPLDIQSDKMIGKERHECRKKTFFQLTDPSMDILLLQIFSLFLSLDG